MTTMVVALLGLAAVALSAGSDDAQAGIVSEMHRLADRYAAAIGDGEREAELAAMRALDPEHPQPFVSVLIRYWPEEREAVLERLLALGEPGGPSRALSRGLVAMLARRHPEANAALVEALTRYERAGHLAGMATTCNNLGNVARGEKRWPAAIEHMTRSLDLHRRLRDERNLAQVHGNLAETWRRYAAVASRRHDLSTALERLEPGLEHAHRADRLTEARLLADRGEVLIGLDRSARALPDLRRASEVLDAEGRREAAVRARGKVGLALLKLGRYEEARTVLERVLREAEEGGHAQTAAAAKIDLASLAPITGSVADSIVLLGQALDWYREQDSLRGRFAAVQSLSAAYFRLRDLESAEAYARQAVALAAAIGPAVTGRARSVLAAILAQRKRYADALAIYETAIVEMAPTNSRGAAIARVNAALPLHRLGRVAEARAMLDRGLRALREHRAYADQTFALNLSGDFYRRAGDFERALDEHRAALELAQRLGIRDRAVEARWLAGNVYHATDRFGSALRAYRAAIRDAERQRTTLGSAELSLHYFADQVDLYERAVATLLRTKSASSAEVFDLFERSRARALLDLLAEARGSLRRNVADSVRSRERDVLDALSSAAVLLRTAETEQARNAATATVREAERRFAAFQVELARSARSYAEIAYPEPRSLADVQRVLRPGEVVLEYFLGDEHAWRLVVGPAEARFDELAPGTAIRSLAEALLEQAGEARMTLGGRPAGAAAAAALGRAVLPERFPPETRRVIVVADGPLHRVPFEALMRDGRYLIEDYEVVVVPSATALYWMRESPVTRSDGGFLGFGAPSGGDDPRFPTLTHAGAALETIARGFAPHQRRVLVGDAATEAALRALPLGDFRFVHFATHGWIDSERPRHSGLLLSTGSPGTGDGFLHLDEVFPLPLNAELVVLSACRSAVGELLRGEGFVGMTRAFLYAGSDAVLATLWNVNDRSAAEFMIRFYEELGRHGGAVPALRATKLAFLSSDRPARRQLYRWAPFVIIGEAGEPRRPVAD